MNQKKTYDINSITLAGRLTRDPETRPAGQTNVTKFGFGSNSGEHANFLDVECWGKLSEIASSYLKKGKYVAVVGRLEIGTFNDNAGNSRKYCKVKASEINFVPMSSGRREEEANGNVNHEYKPDMRNEVKDGEIPF